MYWAIYSCLLLLICACIVGWARSRTSWGPYLAWLSCHWRPWCWWPGCSCNQTYSGNHCRLNKSRFRSSAPNCQHDRNRRTCLLGVWWKRPCRWLLTDPSGPRSARLERSTRLEWSWHHRGPMSSLGNLGDRRGWIFLRLVPLDHYPSVAYFLPYLARDSYQGRPCSQAACVVAWWAIHRRRSQCRPWNKCFILLCRDRTRSYRHYQSQTLYRESWMMSAIAIQECQLLVSSKAWLWILWPFRSRLACWSAHWARKSLPPSHATLSPGSTPRCMGSWWTAGGLRCLIDWWRIRPGRLSHGTDD